MAARSSRSSRLGNLALLVVTVVVFLGLLEIVLRTFDSASGESPLLFDRRSITSTRRHYVYRRKDEG